MKITRYILKELMNLRIFTILFLLLSTVVIGQSEGGFGGWGGPAGGGSPGGGGSSGGSGSSGGGMGSGITNAIVYITGNSGVKVNVHTTPGTYNGYATLPRPTISVPSNTISYPSYGGSNYGGPRTGLPPVVVKGSSGSGSTKSKEVKNTETIFLKEEVKPGQSKEFKLKIPVGTLPSVYVAEYTENGKVVGTIEFYRPENGFFTRMKVTLIKEASSPITSITPTNTSADQTTTKQASDGSIVTFIEVKNVTDTPPPPTVKTDSNGDIKFPWSITVGTDNGSGGSPGSPQNQADLIAPPPDVYAIGCNASCGGSFQYMETMTLADIKRTVRDCPCGEATIEEKEKRMGTANSEFEQYVEEILNNPPPAGANKFVYVDYHNKITEVLEYVGGTDNLAMAELFKNAAAKEAFLKATEQYKIAQNGRNIVEVGKPIQLNWSKASLEDLKEVSQDAAEVAVIEDNADSSFWPKNAQEWEAVLNVMAPLLLEVAIAFVPGSDVIELFRSLSNGDKIGVALAVGGLVVDAVGGTAIKAAIKGAKIYKKATVIATKLGGVVIAAGKAAKKGFKTTIDSAGNLILKNGDDIIAAGDDAVKSVIKHVDEGLPRAGTVGGETLENLSKARKLPGKASGSGKTISGKWLKGSDGNAGLFPKSVADKMKGKNYDSFDKFREDFWKNVSGDPKLADQFSEANKTLMKNGKAPKVKNTQNLGGQNTYQLHHNTPINRGGGVYNVDNLTVVTPRYHKEILSPGYHRGYGY